MAFKILVGMWVCSFLQIFSKCLNIVSKFHVVWILYGAISGVWGTFRQNWWSCDEERGSELGQWQIMPLIRIHGLAKGMYRMESSTNLRAGALLDLNSDIILSATLLLHHRFTLTRTFGLDQRAYLCCNNSSFFIVSGVFRLLKFQTMDSVRKFLGSFGRFSFSIASIQNGTHGTHRV